MVDVLIKEVGAAPRELQEEGDGLLLRNVSILLEIDLEVATLYSSYPPAQYSRKK